MKDRYNITFATIEKKQWLKDIPSEDDSYVMRTSYKLHSKRICDFTPEDTRFVIVQEWHLDYIVPYAISLLQKDMFMETDIGGRGSLLETVLRIDATFWKEYPGSWKDLNSLYKEQFPRIFELDGNEYIAYDLEKAYKRFAEAFDNS